MPGPCEECVSPLVFWDVARECPRTLVVQWLSPLHPDLAVESFCVPGQRWISDHIMGWELRR